MGQFADGTPRDGHRWASRKTRFKIISTTQEISQEHAALHKNRLYRRWGIKTAREYARIKIYVLRLFFGKPDFTTRNAPGHGDDDARFYDRQQAYVYARGG